MAGTKYDLKEDLEPQATDTFAQLHDIKHHFKVSAKENSGIREMFEAIAKCLHSINQVHRSTTGTVVRCESAQLEKVCLIQTNEPQSHYKCVPSCSRSQ